MSHHTILGPTAQHERFMREVTRELDAFEEHERAFRADERRERLEALQAVLARAAPPTAPSADDLQATVVAASEPQLLHVS
jgi:hypothetical protein